ncbi:uncharacterized protein Pyn_41250 [Prunus yedoensis var. nudiflora]|uniref:GRF-type domain-containing protein n=1 Tax=Prunus yedoensis var. nudiflora TaxID=2094558 RepID=A0A314YA06_PRUYE|nr:uncharacterized protein Pyn_41250 [Prunus yedoensis var. nudiflora]
MPGMDEEAPMCWCGKVATIRTSWTNSNLGRRFSMCAEKVRENNKGFKGCQFWAWFDLEMCERSKAVIHGLLKSRNKLEKLVAEARQREKVVWVLLVASWVLFASFILGGMRGFGVNKMRSFELASAML